MKSAGVILCGGLGTRIQQISGNLPKCLLPIAGIPFLSLLISKLRSDGFEHLVVVGGPHVEELRAFTLRHNLDGVQILMHKSDGTARAVSVALDYLSSNRVDTALIVNGDTVLDISYAELLNFHEYKRSDITIVTSTRSDVQNRGAIEVDDQTNRVLRFGEGSHLHAGSGQSNCGSYLINIEKCISWFNKTALSSLEREVLPTLVSVLDVFAYCNGDRFFVDFGSVDRFAMINRMREKIRHIYAIS